MQDKLPPRFSIRCSQLCKAGNKHQNSTHWEYWIFFWTSVLVSEGKQSKSFLHKLGHPFVSQLYINPGLYLRIYLPLLINNVSRGAGYHTITGFTASDQLALIENNIELRKMHYSWGSASTMHKIHIQAPMHRLQNQSAQYLGIFVSRYLYSSEIVPATIIQHISDVIRESLYLCDVKDLTDQKNEKFPASLKCKFNLS